MRRGEVRWYRVTKPDKRKLVVVLTRDSALEFLGEVTVAPVTTRRRGLATEVVLTTQEGMPKDCAIDLDSMATIEKAVLTNRICELSGEKKAQVHRAIRFALDLP